MGQPQELRRGNRQRVVQLLLDQLLTGEGSLTRPQLAELTGLSKVTVSAIVQELQEAGLLELARQDARRDTLGRVPQSVRLSKNGGTVLACDIQPAQVSLRLQALCSAERTEQTLPGPTTPLLLKQLAQVAQTQPFGRLRQVVVGLPAPVTPAGEVGEPNAVSGLDTAQLRAWAQGAGVPLAFENDANLAALSAHQLLPEYSHLAALIERPSGTGLGLLLEGRLYRGVRGQAGELGRSLWPASSGPERLEELPAAERLSATGYLLASLVQTLDLQHVVLGLSAARAERLESQLRPLLPPEISLSQVQDVGRLALDGAALRAAELARRQFLAEVNTLNGGTNHVA